jgi:hypothetical protein
MIHGSASPLCRSCLSHSPVIRVPASAHRQFAGGASAILQATSSLPEGADCVSRPQIQPNVLVTSAPQQQL